MKYKVFTRRWFRANPEWPDGLEPCPGRKTTLRKGLGLDQARALCEQWNSDNDPGKYSRKAEFEQQ